MKTQNLHAEGSALKTPKVRICQIFFADKNDFFHYCLDFDSVPGNLQTSSLLVNGGDFVGIRMQIGMLLHWFATSILPKRIRIFATEFIYWKIEIYGSNSCKAHRPL